MRRILISNVENIAIKYKQNVFKGCRKKPINGGIGNLEKMRDLIIQSHCKNWIYFANYVQTLIEKFDDLLLLKPYEFQFFYNDYLEKLNVEVESLNWRIWGRYEPKITFADALVDAMRFDWVRSYYPEIANGLGIKACVYCNASYTVNTNVKDDDVKGRYELDHFWPKSKYPFCVYPFIIYK